MIVIVVLFLITIVCIAEVIAIVNKSVTDSILAVVTRLQNYVLQMKDIDPILENVILPNLTRIIKILVVLVLTLILDMIERVAVLKMNLHPVPTNTPVNLLLNARDTSFIRNQERIVLAIIIFVKVTNIVEEAILTNLAVLILIVLNARLEKLSELNVDTARAAVAVVIIDVPALELLVVTRNKLFVIRRSDFKI